MSTMMSCFYYWGLPGKGIMYTSQIWSLCFFYSNQVISTIKTINISNAYSFFMIQFYQDLDTKWKQKSCNIMKSFIIIHGNMNTCQNAPTTKTPPLFTKTSPLFTKTPPFFYQITPTIFPNKNYFTKTPPIFLAKTSRLIIFFYSNNDIMCDVL